MVDHRCIAGRRSGKWAGKKPEPNSDGADAANRIWVFTGSGWQIGSDPTGGAWADPDPKTALANCDWQHMGNYGAEHSTFELHLYTASRAQVYLAVAWVQDSAVPVLLPTQAALLTFLGAMSGMLQEGRASMND
jgi:hypothetical protein